MRIALLTQWFPPEPAGPELWVARELEARGLEPRVITGIPNYPGGKVLPGYRASRPVRDNTEGFVIQRCPLYPSHSSSSLKRFANYGSFAVSSMIFGRRLMATADVTLVYCSPATAGMGAYVANVLHGTPYVLWIQDLWPDSVFATGFLKGGLQRRVAGRSLSRFTSALYSRAAYIAVITEGMRELLLERGVPDERVSVIHNWTDEGVMKPVAPTGVLRAKLGIPADHVVVMYAGAHGRAQRLGAWIRAFALVQDLPSLSLVMIGEGEEKPALIQQAAGLKNVHFLPRVDRAQVTSWIAESDVQVISLADDPIFDITLPSKTQSSLACGKAVIASVRGDLARVLKSSGAGWSARPEDPVSIAECIRSAYLEGRVALADRGSAGRRYYLHKMSARAGGDAMEQLIRRASESRSTVRQG